jgi:hypothetical protein
LFTHKSHSDFPVVSCGCEHRPLALREVHVAKENVAEGRDEGRERKVLRGRGKVKWENI